MTGENIKLEMNEKITHDSNDSSEMKSNFPETEKQMLCNARISKNTRTKSKLKNTKQSKPRCKCKFCDETFTTIDEMSLHQINCSEKDSDISNTDERTSFVCKVCSQFFKHETGLMKHELRHRPPGGFICSECNERFLTDAERLLHKETIHKIFKCLICAAKYISEADYLSHITDKHGGRDREYVVCTDCGAQFRQPNQLKLHNASKCGTLRSFTCEKCGSKFMNQNTLNAHMLIHVGEKKHLCNFCGNSFLSRGQLKNHERSHTGEKPFKCDVCNKAFSHRESLVTHSSLHTGIKPYLCESCGSRFSCIGNLIKHRKARQHTCGLPQFCKNTKCAPRASSKNIGSLTMKNVPKIGRAYTKRKGIDVPELLEDRKELVAFERKQSEPHIEQTLNENETVELQNDTTDIKTEDRTSESEEFPENFNDLLILRPKTESIENTQLQSELVITSNSTDPTYDSVWMNQYQEQQTQNIQYDNNTTVTYNISDVVFVIDNDGNGEHVLLNPKHHSNLIDLNNIKISGIALPEKTTSEIIILDSNEYEDHEMIEDLNEIEIETKEIKDDEFILGVSSYMTATDSMDKFGNDETDDDMTEKFDGEKKAVLENTDDYISDKSDSNKEEEEERSMQSIDINEMYQCDECPGQFKYQKSFLKHMKCYHNKTDLKASNKVLKKQKKTIYTCNSCDKTYTSEKLYNKHIVWHGDDGNLVHRCSCCPLYFATLEEMQTHQTEEHKSKLTCNICNKKFKDPECVSSHVRHVHTKTAEEKKKYEYVCTKCGKKFCSRVAMSDHERADCGRSPIYKCNHCNKFYHSAGSLKTHQLIHSGDLSHLCNFCGKGFRTQGQVKVHERSHNGEKPYKCDHCSKSFAHRESLLTHLSLHTGIKRFMCQGCSSRFSCISNLQAHRRSHKTTCGMLPNMTKAVGPDGNVRQHSIRNE